MKEVTVDGREVKDPLMRNVFRCLADLSKKDLALRELLHQNNVVVDKPECTSCGNDINLNDTWCRWCGRILKDELDVKISKHVSIRINKEFQFFDQNEVKHTVPALVIGDRNYHFGENGFYVSD